MKIVDIVFGRIAFNYAYPIHINKLYEKRVELDTDEELDKEIINSIGEIELSIDLSTEAGLILKDMKSKIEKEEFLREDIASLGLLGYDFQIIERKDLTENSEISDIPARIYTIDGSIKSSLKRARVGTAIIPTSEQATENSIIYQVIQSGQISNSLGDLNGLDDLLDKIEQSEIYSSGSAAVDTRILYGFLINMNKFVRFYR